MCGRAPHREFIDLDIPDIYIYIMIYHDISVYDVMYMVSCVSCLMDARQLPSICFGTFWGTWERMTVSIPRSIKSS